MEHKVTIRLLLSPFYRCIGVWDTVGAVYNMIDALSIKDTNLPTIVDVALHAVCLQDNRREFRPTLWTLQKDSNQILKEVRRSQLYSVRAYRFPPQIWFPGAHSDVGGSYARHELADIALFWMTVCEFSYQPALVLDQYNTTGRNHRAISLRS